MKRSFAASAVVTFASVGVLVTGAAIAAVGDSTWHLERIIEPANPVDGVFTRPGSTGSGVDIYVVDEHVRPTHVEFAGRVGPGLDLIGTSVDPSVCTGGHGTHVAGLAAGATRGVATGSRVIPVRVLGCDGEGDVSDVVAALRWIARRQQSGRLAVVNLSLGLNFGTTSDELETAVRDLIADGMVVVLAAGNGDSFDNGIDACRASPARVTEALTVGATTRTDSVATYSNHGACVDIFAPGGSTTGSEINSGWISGDTVYADQSGTSMAAPLVSGYVALLAARQPSLCPAQINTAVIERATVGAITGLDPMSPNRLLFLDDSAIGTTSVPGRPTGVLASVANSSLFVTWDPPCDGGSAVDGYTVVLRSGGRIVRTIGVPGTQRSLRIRNLRNGTGYSVAVRATNAVGEGPVSVRSAVMTPRRLTVGSATRLTTILRDRDGFSGSWTVTQGSRTVCRLANSPRRLVVRRAGTCIVQVTPRDADQQVTHRITVG